MELKSGKLSEEQAREVSKWKYEGSKVFFGIGINPKYCNKGIEKRITKLALDKCKSKSKYPNKPAILEVRTWNTRAVNCYKSQGFEIIEVKSQETCLGKGEFYVMVYYCQRN